MLPIVTLSLLKKNSFTIPKDEKEILIEALIACLILLVGLVIIMLVHELIHAFLYKKYTNEKPRLIINLQEISLKVENHNNVRLKYKENITDFVLTTNNNVLNRAYCEKVAASLAREGVTTALDAMNYLKSVNEKRKSNIKIATRRPKNTKIEEETPVVNTTPTEEELDWNSLISDIED